MNLIINYNTLYYYEGLMAVIKGYNNDAVLSMKRELLDASGAEPDTELKSFLESTELLPKLVMEHIDMKDEKAEFLFKSRSKSAPYAMAFWYYQQYTGSLDRNKFLSIASMIMNIVEDKLESEMDFFQWIDEYDCDAAYKYDFLKLYYKYDIYHSYVTDIVTTAEETIHEFLQSIQQHIDEHVDRIAAYLKETKMSLIPYKFEPDAIVNLYPSIVMPDVLTMQQFNDTNTFNLISGVILLELLELHDKNNSRESFKMEKFLKVLADPTKMSILKLLKDENCNNAQLAKKLELTGATISHHMSTLVQLELVLAEPHGVKIFYSFNRIKYERFIEELNRQML